MTKEEAVVYLRSRGVEVEAAETAYDLAGGSIVHLRLIADALNAGENFDSIPLLPEKIIFSLNPQGLNGNFDETRAHMFQVLNSCLARAIMTKGPK